METEIKLLASAAMLENLRELPGLAADEHAAQLVTRYFDTPTSSLHHAQASLRLRDSDGHSEQTFKQSGRHSKGAAGVRREEWNAPASGDRPDPAGFPPTAAAALAELVAVQDLALFAAVTVQRRTRNVRHGKSLIEVAFDSGEIAAAERNEPICECELELREGDLSDVLALVQGLPLGPELRWSLAAKGTRAFALAHGEPAGAMHPRKVVLTRKMSVAEAFRAIGWNCLDHLLRNIDVLVARADNDALHQCRVAIRRLRAALGLFADSIDHATATRYREAFGSAATVMGEAREVHVLLEALDKSGQANHQADDATTELIPELTARRDAALALSAAQLAGADFQQLLFEFAGWIETAKANADAPDTLPEFASRTLDHLRKRVKHAGRHLPALADDDLHRLRIKIKKLRYAVEFFTELAPHDRHKAARKYAKMLGKLQDRLGTLHDLAERSPGGALFAAETPERAALLQAELTRQLEPNAAARGELVDDAARELKTLLVLPRWH